LKSLVSWPTLIKPRRMLVFPSRADMAAPLA
jgi:hypothetical protein